jgi:hypothetical protein
MGNAGCMGTTIQFEAGFGPAMVEASLLFDSHMEEARGPYCFGYRSLTFDR